MARVRLVAPGAGTSEQEAVFAEVGRQRGGVGHLFQAMIHSPGATRQVGALGAYVRFDATLPAALRETVILAVAGRWQCAYELRHHRPLAARLGLPDAQVTALSEGQVPTDLPPLETAAVRYAQALTRDAHADADVVEGLRAELGETGLVELTVLIGYYSLLAMFLNGLDVDLDPDPPLPPA